MPEAWDLPLIAPTSGKERFELSEKVTVTPGRLMLALAQYVPDLIDLPTSGLPKYLSHAASNGGQVSVRYTDPENGIGRLDITPFTTDSKGATKDLTMVSQPHLWNVVKAAACSDHYIDCDIKDCHPTLILQMCEKENLPCGTLKRYIEQRSDLIAETGLEKRHFKQLFFSTVLYHPQCTEEQLQRKLKKFGLPKEPALFTQLREEMRTASEHLLSQHPCYMEAAVAAKGSDYFNLPGTAFSLLAQTAEKRCILALHDFWFRNRVHVGALIHDGLHVDKEAATVGHLKPASDYIYEKTGYRVTLEFKEWEPHPVYEQSVIANDAMDCLRVAFF